VKPRGLDGELSEPWEPAEIVADLAACDADELSLLRAIVLVGGEQSLHDAEGETLKLARRLAARFDWCSLGPEPDLPIACLDPDALRYLGEIVAGTPRRLPAPNLPPSAPSRPTGQLREALKRAAEAGGLLPIARLPRELWKALIANPEGLNGLARLAEGRPDHPDLKAGGLLILEPATLHELRNRRPPLRWTSPGPGLAIAAWTLAADIASGKALRTRGGAPRAWARKLVEGLRPSQAVYPPRLRDGESVELAIALAQTLAGASSPEAELIPLLLASLRELLAVAPAGARARTLLASCDQSLSSLPETGIDLLPRSAVLDELLSALKLGLPPEGEAQEDFEETVAELWAASIPVYEALGLAEIGLDEDGLPVAVRASHAARSLLGAVPGARPRAILTEQRPAQLGILLSDAPLSTLLRIATRAALSCAEGGAFLARIPPASIFAEGGPTALLAPCDLGPKLKALGGTGSSLLRARLRRWLVLEIPSADLADALAEDPRLASLIQDRITPTVLLLKDRPLHPAELAAFKSQGLVIQEEEP